MWWLFSPGPEPVFQGWYVNPERRTRRGGSIGATGTTDATDDVDGTCDIDVAVGPRGVAVEA